MIIYRDNAETPPTTPKKSKSKMGGFLRSMRNSYLDSPGQFTKLGLKLALIFNAIMIMYITDPGAFGRLIEAVIYWGIIIYLLMKFDAWMQAQRDQEREAGRMDGYYCPACFAGRVEKLKPHRVELRG